MSRILDIQKIVSAMMIATLITSQIGCAGKIKKVSQPIDQIKFDKDHQYTVNLKNGESFKSVIGDKIKTKSNHLTIKLDTEDKQLMNVDVNRILVQKANAKDRRIYGAFIGGLILGGIGFLAGSSIEMGDAGTPEPEGVKGGIALGGIFGLIGVLVGVAVTRPHYDLQITPIVTPTSSGINAGGNLQVKF